MDYANLHEQNFVKGNIYVDYLQSITGAITAYIALKYDQRNVELFSIYVMKYAF